MSLRPLKLPADFPMLGELLVDSFHYPENEEWNAQQDELEALSEMVTNLKRMWPLVTLIQLVSPPLRDIMRGYVWEVEDKPVGVVLIQRRGTTDKWLIGTLAVLPEFRRRGIARKLMSAGIEKIREMGAPMIFLDVIEGNLPAYQLYQDLGFEHYSGAVELTIEPGFENAGLEIKGGYTITSSDIFDWQPRFDLEAAIAPAGVQKYEPVEEGRFRQPALMRMLLPVINLAQGVRIELLILRDRSQGRVIGTGRSDLRTRPGGTHNMSVTLDPAHGEAAPGLLGHLLSQAQEQDAQHRIALTVPRWQTSVLDAACAAGFQKRLEYHRMGLILNEA